MTKKLQDLDKSARKAIFLERYNASFDPNYLEPFKRWNKAVPVALRAGSRESRTGPVIVSFDDVSDNVRPAQIFDLLDTAPNATVEIISSHDTNEDMFPFAMSMVYNPESNSRIIKEVKSHPLWNEIPDEIRQTRLNDLYDDLANGIVQSITEKIVPTPKPKRINKRKEAQKKDESVED